MTSPTQPHWIAVGALTDIPPAGARPVRTPLGSIALFRTADDQVFALKDQCPHRGGPLAQGMVYGHRVCCPMHGLSIDLQTGEAVAPDTGCAARYRVRIENGTVYLSLADQAAHDDAA